MLNMTTIRDLSQNTSGDILSLYLHVDPAYQPNQSEQPAWQIFVRNTLRELESAANDSDRMKAIRSQLESFLDGYLPQGKSLVLFVNENGILQRFDLPVIVDNHYSFGQIDTVPLLWAMDEYKPYLVVLVDSEKARFISAHPGRVTTDEEMHLDFDDYDFGNKRFIHANHSAPGDAHQGSGGDNFDDMKSAHIRRFHSDVAEQIRHIIPEMQAERIILGGNEQAAHEVKNLLHHSLQDHLVGIIPVPVDASNTRVAEKIQSLALNYERSQELDIVNELIDLTKSGGRGALGTADVLNAMEMQQVELLVLPYPPENTELAVTLSTMALDSGADVELVHGIAATRLRDEGQVAARLYYRINEPETTA